MHVEDLIGIQYFCGKYSRPHVPIVWLLFCFTSNFTSMRILADAIALYANNSSRAHDFQLGSTTLCEISSPDLCLVQKTEFNHRVESRSGPGALNLLTYILSHVTYSVIRETLICMNRALVSHADPAGEEGHLNFF